MVEGFNGATSIVLSSIVFDAMKPSRIYFHYQHLCSVTEKRIQKASVECIFAAQVGSDNSHMFAESLGLSPPFSKA